MCDPFIDVNLAREYVADALVFLDDPEDLTTCKNLLQLVIEILDGDVSNVYSE